MNSLYYLLLLLCPYMSLAQPLPKGLQVGDQLPAVKANNVLNHTASSINTADYRGRLLVLDFMRTTCGGCIGKLEAYEQLERQYSNRLVIVLVTQESPAVVKAYMKRPTAKKLRFPIITADEKLIRLFPHQSLSHLVWIDTAGKVKAITEGDWLIAENIPAALGTDSLTWPVKRDIPYFDYSSPMITLGEQTAAFIPKPLQYGVLLPYLPDVPSRFTAIADSATGNMRWQFFNQSIIQLYTRLYRKFHFPLSNVVLRVKNKARYEYQSGSGPRRAWQEQYALSYEALLPYSLDTNHNRRKIQHHLDALLDVTSSFENQPMNCLVITPLSTTVLQKQPAEGLLLWSVANLLNQRFSEQPVLLASDSLNRVIINISEKELGNELLLRQRLMEAGFGMMPQTREMEVLLIKEN